MVFVGRGKELRKLEQLYSKEDSMTCAIYGRRRVGKTTLIQEFCKGKNSLFLTSTATSEKVLLYSYAQAFSINYGRDVVLDDFLDLFTKLTEYLNATDDPVIVIDEFPFLIKVFPDALSLLQRFIDHDMKAKRSMLILSGSSMSSMVRSLNDGESPLFQRFVVQMRIDPLSYPEACLLHPDYSEEDRMRAYAIAGGIPPYHIIMDGRGLERSIEDSFLSRSNYLGGEIEHVFSLELKPWDTYDRVLTTLSNGDADIETISKDSGLSVASCRSMLSDLEELGAVAYELPYGKKRYGHFRIVDGFMGFYYSVIKRMEGTLANLDYRYESIRVQAETFYGHRFEEICKQYIVQNNDCRWIGRWWGTIPIRDGDRILKGPDGKVETEEADIDVVAVTRVGQSEALILGECKFTRRKVDIPVLETLVRRAGSIGGLDRNRRYVLFSRSGFTYELKDEVDERWEGRVELVDIDTISEWVRKTNDGEEQAQ